MNPSTEKKQTHGRREETVVAEGAGDGVGGRGVWGW